MHRPVVLVVDDEEDLLHLLSTAFGVALPGVEVASARTGAEALAVIERVASRGARVGAAVLDHVLEGEDGLALADAVRTRSAGASVLLYTGRADEQTVARARAKGVQVLWKPTTLTTLVQVVERAVAVSAA
jgi:DNA-binding NtrC family response regulator